jgi:hypothetical protein
MRIGVKTGDKIGALHDNSISPRSARLKFCSGPHGLYSCPRVLFTLFLVSVII